MKNDCQVCAELWRAYAWSTHALKKIESKLHLVRLTHDVPATETLLAAEQAASELRTQCREEVQSHEQAAHKKVATDLH